jgi:hypothetical protein
MAILKVKRVYRFDSRTRAGRGLACSGAERILAMRWEIVGCEQRRTNGGEVRAEGKKVEAQQRNEWVQIVGVNR